MDERLFLTNARTTLKQQLIRLRGLSEVAVSFIEWSRAGYVAVHERDDDASAHVHDENASLSPNTAPPFSLLSFSYLDKLAQTQNKQRLANPKALLDTITSTPFGGQSQCAARKVMEALEKIERMNRQDGRALLPRRPLIL